MLKTLSRLALRTKSKHSVRRLMRITKRAWCYWKVRLCYLWPLAQGQCGFNLLLICNFAGVRDELHAKVDQTAIAINDTASLHKKETDRSIDRAITSSESRADGLESAAERDVASVRGES